MTGCSYVRGYAGPTQFAKQRQVALVIVEDTSKPSDAMLLSQGAGNTGGGGSSLRSVSRLCVQEGLHFFN